MNLRTKSNFLLIAALFLTAVFIYLPFCTGDINKALSKCPDVENGVADFSLTKTKNSPWLYLSGNWEYYSGKHIITDGTAEMNGYVSVTPNLSPASLNLRNTSGYHSSYKVTVKNLHYDNAIIFVPHFAGSYRVFLNGMKIAESGNYTSTGTSANLETKATAVTIQKNQVYEIVIEVSCKMMPGLYMTPVIADYDNAVSHLNIAMILRCVIFGIVLFCGLFAFLLPLNKHNIFDSNWLSALCFFVAIRMMVSTDGYTVFNVFFHSVDYETMTLLICVLTFIIKLVALLFYTETMGLKIGKGVFTAFCVAFFIFSLLISFFPNAVANPYYYIIMQASTLPLDIIILSNLANSVAKKVPYSLFYTVGYIAIISGIMVDCFYTNGLIPFVSSSYMPALFGLFVVTFILIFSKNTAEIYKTALKAAKLDKELSDANTAVMISQIQPHFLYNALNTIKILIKRDPKTAENAIISFSKYLRCNMDSITQKTPIPFADELEHIKNYCYIELLRFGDKINIVYKTECTDFKVPALSIQPLVENAIKHGVTKKAEGGTVTIESYETENEYIVKISDDGVGFDTSAPEYSDSSRSHIGLENTTNRLKQLSNATVDIKSKPDEGTEVTIKISKKGSKTV